uniref:Uncharacterized protein n=1 Tax=Rousettus aegyptiacus TaxID=9407 RepID=A0A7J8CHL0_ROUAE|nr:hypothetical protein HJG63_008920 [Rousettus aegyptiacus]
MCVCMGGGAGNAPFSFPFGLGNWILTFRAASLTAGVGGGDLSPSLTSLFIVQSGRQATYRDEREEKARRGRKRGKRGGAGRGGRRRGGGRAPAPRGRADGGAAHPARRVAGKVDITALINFAMLRRRDLA